MELFLEQQSKPSPEPNPLKEFKSKHGLPKLDDYSVKPSEAFWSKINKVCWEEVAKVEGGINADKLEQLARQVRYPDQAMLTRVLSYLREGAKLGVSRECQVSSTSSNAPSSLEHGEEVTDALVEWLDNKYAIGPFEPAEIPFKKCKISGLMCKMKPNGKARIIVNMSKGKPTSVNEGINKDDFPTAMSSTRAWVRILWRCGKNSKFIKCDWSAAYKQVITSHLTGILMLGLLDLQ